MLYFGSSVKAQLLTSQAMLTPTPSQAGRRMWLSGELMSVPLLVTSSEAVFPEQRRGQSCGLQSGAYLEWTLGKLAKSK